MGARSHPAPAVSGARDEETIAAMAAVEQFMRDTTPAPAARAVEPAPNPWTRAALLEGVSRQPGQ